MMYLIKTKEGTRFVNELKFELSVRLCYDARLDHVVNTYFDKGKMLSKELVVLS